MHTNTYSSVFFFFFLHTPSQHTFKVQVVFIKERKKVVLRTLYKTTFCTMWSLFTWTILYSIVSFLNSNSFLQPYTFEKHFRVRIVAASVLTETRSHTCGSPNMRKIISSYRFARAKKTSRAKD